MAVLRYWAGAREAAGVTEQSVDVATLAEALDAARSGRGERFAQVLGVCSFVVDEQPVGLTPHGEVKLAADSVVEVLPPFAGGAGDGELSAGRQTRGGARGGARGGVSAQRRRPNATSVHDEQVTR